MKDWWGGNTYDYLRKDFVIRRKKEKCFFKKWARGDTSHNNKKVKEEIKSGQNICGDRRGRKRKKKQGVSPSDDDYWTLPSASTK